MQQIFKGMDNGASTIDANFNELVNANLPTANKTVQDLIVNGQFKITTAQTIYTKNFSAAGLTFVASRIGNLVFLNINGNPNKGDWNLLGTGIIPVGYRTSVDTYAALNDNNGFVKFGFGIDGGISRRGSYNFDGSILSTVIFKTNDAFPSN